ncbi:MAG: UTP--glucose-1-phosphate uridylyltransferase [Candidatus Microsaccharimonas sp.]
MKQPTKAIICAAGLGTRFLPQTKAMPKEMLPLIDRPVIQVIVEAAVAAGVTEIIIVTGSTKRAIEDHFDRSDALEAELRENGKDDKAEEIKRIAELANFVYVRQKGTPKGNARPILNARHLISDDEPFFVFFADDFFRSDVPWPVQMKDAYNQTGKSIVAVSEVPLEDTKKYGIVSLSEERTDRLFKIDGFVEKPEPSEAPSRFSIVGTYLLTPDIWQYLEKEKVSARGEVEIGDAMLELAEADDVFAYFVDGVRHDTGDQLKYIEAVVDMALESEEYGEELRTFLKERLG